MRKKMVQKAKECMKAKASKSEIYGRMQDVFIEMEPSPKACINISLSFSFFFSKKLTYQFETLIRLVW